MMTQTIVDVKGCVMGEINHNDIVIHHVIILKVINDQQFATCCQFIVRLFILLSFHDRNVLQLYMKRLANFLPYHW